MKNLSFILTVFVCLLFSVGAKAQTNADFFAGKWAVTVFGTPNGDNKINFLFEKKDGKLSGVVQDSTGKEISKITQITEKDKTITADFRAQDYDVNITLEPVDADNVKGSVMSMFDAKGVRVKEGK